MKVILTTIVITCTSISALANDAVILVPKHSELLVRMLDAAKIGTKSSKLKKIDDLHIVKRDIGIKAFDYNRKIRVLLSEKGKVLGYVPSNKETYGIGVTLVTPTAKRPNPCPRIAICWPPVGSLAPSHWEKLYKDFSK